MQKVSDHIAMNEKSNLRVLIAASPNSARELVRMLENRFTVHTVSSLSDALAYHRTDNEAIICGLCFDESRMFDFLRHLDARPASDVNPFICVNAHEQVLSEPIIRSIDIASRALGAIGFIDLCQWNGRYGKVEAALKFQRLVEEALRRS